jgi:hypothetical protein
MLKVSGPPVANVQGLEIHFTNHPSKTGRGKDRLWLHVRQSKPKKWRVSASLCYVNGFDVRFEK